ncbi:hypothetical protein J4460_06410 [Candidatus Woesearchaeota archaeon]|nr:hypothetical protein [Candidatus Woesearchaeota archaeon]HIH38207.1 hypothetical protein [Candidatus Woesearchaeota archaeon]HIH49502.1 hypothetical protein [Candidatus Woesearchaeota archaeon]HIJ03884.1 hypothetical protein [Candidatus Woesearchaeota archaeon]
MEKGKKRRICPECGSEKVDYQAGELVCLKCGLVIDDSD